MSLPSLTRAEYLRYSRHLQLPEIGLDGQRRLKACSALIVGLGGLGSPVALYLAAAGVGRLGLVDFDTLDESDLQRQVLYGTATIGTLKVEAARTRLVDLNPGLQVDGYDEPFTSSNAMSIAAGYDLLLDCSDNFLTRYLVNDVCVLLGKPDVFGSVNRYDGQLSVFDSQQGPCYRCLYPEPPPPSLIQSLSGGPLLGTLPGTIGTLQATEALKLMLGIGSHLVGKLLVYDALDLSFDIVRLRKDPGCIICSAHPELTGLIDYNAFCGVTVPGHDLEGSAPDWEIEAIELGQRLQRGDRLILIDVRDPHELAISSLPQAHNIPLGELAGQLDQLDPEAELVLFCRTGIRSALAREILTGAGFLRVKSLRGGINAWARAMDANLPVY